MRTLRVCFLDLAGHFRAAPEAEAAAHRARAGPLRGHRPARPPLASALARAPQTRAGMAAPRAAASALGQRRSSPPGPPSRRRRSRRCRRRRRSPAREPAAAPPPAAPGPGAARAPPAGLPLAAASPAPPAGPEPASASRRDAVPPAGPESPRRGEGRPPPAPLPARGLGARVCGVLHQELSALCRPESPYQGLGWTHPTFPPTPWTQQPLPAQSPLQGLGLTLPTPPHHHPVLASLWARVCKPRPEI